MATSFLSLDIYCLSSICPLQSQFQNIIMSSNRFSSTLMQLLSLPRNDVMLNYNRYKSTHKITNMITQKIIMWSYTLFYHMSTAFYYIKD